MAARIRELDWSATPLGTIANWPQRLKTVIDLMLADLQPVIVGWGPDLVLLYNDRYIPLMGAKHPVALSLPCSAVWSAAWSDFQHEAETVMAGQSRQFTFPPLPPGGFSPTDKWSSSWTPVRDEAGLISGFYGVAIEATSDADERLLAASKAARAQVTATLESIGDAFYAVDGDFRLTYVNAKAEALWGRPRDTLIGHDLWSEFPQAIGGEPYMQHLAAMRDRQPAHFEGFFLVLNRWMEASVYPDLVSGGLVCYFRDTTERHAAEAALRESEERYRTLFESIDQGFCIADRVPGAAIDFRYVEVNPAFERHTGLADAVGRTMRELVPEAKEANLQRYARVADGGSSERFTSSLFDREYQVEALATGLPGQVAMLFRDITTTRQAEMALRKSEERQAFLLRLSDALRPINDAAQIKTTASHVLGGHLRVDRARYYEVDPTGQYFEADEGYGPIAHVGQVRIEHFGNYLRETYLAGRTLVVANVEADPRIEASQLPSYRNLRMSAFVGVPLIKAGNFVGVLAIAQETPRDWTSQEIAIAEETAERTWAAVERARAEEALRKSESRLAQDLEATQVLQTISNQLISKLGVNGHFDEFCEAARTLMRSDCAGIHLYDEASARLKLAGYVGFHPDSASFWEWVDVSVGSSCGRALANGERVIVPDIDLFEAEPLDLEAYRRSAILSVQSTPLVARTGQIVGMMSTHWHRRDGAAKANYRFFDILARLAADFIVRIRAEAALRESEERQRLTIELVPALLWSASPDGQEVTLNEGWLAYTGQSEIDTQNYGWLNAVHPDDLAATQAAFEHAFSTGEPLERQQRIWNAGNGWRWHLVRHVPVRDESGQITRWFGAAVDIHDSKLAEQALEETELRLQSLIEGVPQLVWRAIDGGHWTWASPQWTVFTGQAEQDSHDWGWLGPVHPEDRERVEGIWSGAIERGEFHAEYRVHHKDEDRYRWVQSRATPVRDEQGEIIEWLGTSTDVDDLRSLQERQQVLVAELQHRTRNLMAVVRSTAQRTGETSKDFDDFRHRFWHRLDALARVQGLLSRLNETDRIAFDELIQTEISAMHGSGERITLDGPSGIRLRSTTVQTLALALHELATNAVKYGALSAPGGHLSISWRLIGLDQYGRPQLRIEWRESGVTMPPADATPQGGGQGRELIERALPYQLDAETSFELGPEGVRCIITIPVSASTKTEGADE